MSKYKKRIKDVYSNPDRLQFNWNLSIIIIINIVNLSSFISQFFPYTFFAFPIIVRAINLMYVIGLGIMGMKQIEFSVNEKRFERKIELYSHVIEVDKPIEKN